jgi:hypothetical protein
MVLQSTLLSKPPWLQIIPTRASFVDRLQEEMKSKRHLREPLLLVIGQRIAVSV